MAVRILSARHKVAIVGCGAAAWGIHCPVLARLSDRFELVVVCDKDPQRAGLLGAAYGVPAVNSFAEVLDRPEIDLVAILTLEHEESIEAAVRAGKHVFTEKPVSLVAATSDRLGTVTVDRGLLLEVGVMRAYDPVFARLRELGGTETARVCSLRKLDGLDVIARSQVLPETLSAYSFDVSGGPAPQLTTQETALRLLLWSGYHLLTGLSLLIDEPRIHAVQVSGSGDQVVATLGGDRGEMFTVTVGDLPGPVYDDTITVALGAELASVSFGPPYGAGGATRLNRHRYGAGPAQVESCSETGFGNPVQQLWADIAKRLDEGWSGPTPTFERAIRVERLAERMAAVAERVEVRS